MVIESGTISRAAQILNVSQPAISKLIANLEFDTELRLFDRVKKRLIPTKHALRLHDEVGRIFSGIRQVESVVDAIRREDQGRIAVGVMPALSGSFVQRVTTSFLKQRPGVFCSFESLSSQCIVDRIIAGTLDIGLIAQNVDHPYIVREPLIMHPLVCIMAPSHPLAAKTIITPPDFNGADFVAFHQDADIGIITEAFFVKHDVSPKVAQVANIAPIVCELVAANLGVSLIHPLSISGFEGRIIGRRCEPAPSYNFNLCRNRDSRDIKLTEAFADIVRKKAQQISLPIVGET